MRVKDTYFITVCDDDHPGCVGIGECNLFKGLSAEDGTDYEDLLDRLCQSSITDVPECSSIIFGCETALANLKNVKRWEVFPSAFTKGETEIPINGLVWMGSRETMRKRIREKIDKGFRCIKLKIGGIGFDQELSLLDMIRKEYSPENLEIRLDANGAFAPIDALKKLDLLSRYSIHSIEQPIKSGQPEEMSAICSRSPIPIALDEELIGVTDDIHKGYLLDEIRPAYIILKPALCGGFAHADRWITMAKERGIGWWATSALESNVGLNAIAQWLYARYGKEVNMPQGLGTGMLYGNNIASPLKQERDVLMFDPNYT